MAALSPLSHALDACSLIPHRGDMALVDKVLAYDSKSRRGLVQAKLQKSNRPYWAADGQFAQHWLIEIMAQGAAAISQALRVESKKQPDAGFLLSIRNWHLIKETHLQDGDIILIDVDFEVDMDP
ncbi:MAG: hypothetical protein NTX25_11355, partial [Proteobacteria bacterium]|nr:hypothetical protein [Pseudomonadota bacterium]